MLSVTKWAPAKNQLVTGNLLIEASKLEMVLGCRLVTVQPLKFALFPVFLSAIFILLYSILLYSA